MKTPLLVACETRQASLVSSVLMAGGCRFTLGRDRRLPHIVNNDDNKEVAALFRSGVDYWQHRLHSGCVA